MLTVIRDGWIVTQNKNRDVVRGDLVIVPEDQVKIQEGDILLTTKL